MHVTVDPERCQGHTLCAMIAPQMFELDEVDGHSSPVTGDVPAGQEEQVREACDEQRLAEPVTVRKAAADLGL